MLPWSFFLYNCLRFSDSNSAVLSETRLTCVTTHCLPWLLRSPIMVEDRSPALYGTGNSGPQRL